MKISVANIQGQKSLHLNLSSVVGAGSVNQHGDVMLIQALLNYIGKGYSSNFVNFKITGTLDSETLSSIRWFQVFNSYRLLGGLGAKHIHPANYENRQINNPEGRLMCITLMNLLAKRTAFRDGKSDYIGEIQKLHPMLNMYILMARGWSKQPA